MWKQLPLAEQQRYAAEGGGGAIRRVQKVSFSTLRFKNMQNKICFWDFCREALRIF